MGYTALFEKNSSQLHPQFELGVGRVYLNNFIKIMFLEQHPNGHMSNATPEATWLGAISLIRTPNPRWSSSPSLPLSITFFTLLPGSKSKLPLGYKSKLPPCWKSKLPLGCRFKLALGCKSKLKKKQITKKVQSMIIG